MKRAVILLVMLAALTATAVWGPLVGGDTGAAVAVSGEVAGEGAPLSFLDGRTL